MGREPSGKVGSSPRMRGAPAHISTLSLAVGIIPADAGSTVDGIGGAGIKEDHPRGCGEHIGTGCMDRVHLGSSPRMRGAPIADHLEEPFQRDHPRGCGEHTLENDILKLERGSSPRMRGALLPFGGH